MSTLHVLWPSTAADAGAELRAWLARGDRLPGVADARTGVTRSVFKFAGNALPVAALRHHARAEDAATDAWLCADPSYIRGEATGARLMASPVADLTEAEAEAFASSLRPLFGDAGMPLALDTPSAWCLRLPSGKPAMPDFVAPAGALGAALLECLPAGDGGRAWRKLFTEVQVALHAHPVNAERAESGRLPVNAVWFWGAGRLPVAVESALGLVASADLALAGLARMAGIECVEPARARLGHRPGFGGQDVLLDPGVAAAGASEVEWLAAFRDWLREGRFAALELAFADGTRVRMRHWHRLRFWRRA